MYENVKIMDIENFIIVALNVQCSETGISAGTRENSNMSLFLVLIPLMLCLSHKCEPGLIGSLESTGGARVTGVFFRTLTSSSTQIGPENFRHPRGVCDWFLLARENSKQNDNQSGHRTDLCTVTSSVRNFRRLSSGLRIGHFRITFSLFLKASLGAHLFI